MHHFKITYWNTVPSEYIRRKDGTLATERIDEVKEAGMDIFLASYDEKTNLECMDYCQTIGLTVDVNDSRMREAVTNADDREKLVTAVVKAYQNHPALFDYYVFDEPNAEIFDDLAAVCRLIDKLDPKHPGYINLFPNYATSEQTGSPDYETHVKDYIKTVDPYLVSYDHYHFCKPDEKMKEGKTFATERDRMIYENAFCSTDRAGFYDNLETVRRCSLASGKPFMNIVLVTEHGPYRNVTEPELRLEGFQTFAYGYSVLSWFTYWIHVNNDGFWNAHNAMIDDGVRMPHYDMVKRINGELHLLGEELAGRKSTAVFHGNDKDLGTTLFPAAGFGGITAFSGNAVIGFFEDGYFCLANKNFIDPESVSLATEKTVEHFSKQTASWETVSPADITLAAGDGELFRLK